MIGNVFNKKTIPFFASGIAVGMACAAAGEADDAPGLGGIGLILAFLLIMRGIYYTGTVKKGLCMPLVFSVFGLIMLIFPSVLLFDGEIERLSAVYLLAMICGAALIVFSADRMIKICRK